MKEALAAFEKFLHAPSDLPPLANSQYGSSIGRWQHYRDQMAAVEARLARLVAAFGYEDGEG